MKLTQDEILKNKYTVMVAEDPEGKRHRKVLEPLMVDTDAGEVTFEVFTLPTGELNLVENLDLTSLPQLPSEVEIEPNVRTVKGKITILDQNFNQVTF
jgi:hypothetical protein